jgi:hypothetical protein
MAGKNKPEIKLGATVRLRAQSGEIVEARFALRGIIPTRLLTKSIMAASLTKTAKTHWPITGQNVGLPWVCGAHRPVRWRAVAVEHVQAFVWRKETIHDSHGTRFSSRAVVRGSDGPRGGAAQTRKPDHHFRSPEIASGSNDEGESWNGFDELDLQDPASVASVAKKLIAQYPKISLKTIVVSAKR